MYVPELSRNLLSERQEWEAHSTNITKRDVNVMEMRGVAGAALRGDRVPLWKEDDGERLETEEEAQMRVVEETSHLTPADKASRAGRPQHSSRARAPSLAFSAAPSPPPASSVLQLI